MTNDADRRGGPAGEIPDGFVPIVHHNPFGRNVGPIYHREEADGGFVRGFRVSEKHVNSGGFAHGGMLLAFADIVLGQACYRVLGGPSVTVNVNANFVAPARLGDWLEGRAEVLRRARKIVFVRGRLTVRRRVVLTADAIFHAVRQPIA